MQNIYFLQLTVRGCEFFRAVQNDSWLNASRTCVREPFSHCEMYIMLLCITQDANTASVASKLLKAHDAPKHTHTHTRAREYASQAEWRRLLLIYNTHKTPKAEAENSPFILKNHD